jgi:hypothetical protein
MDAVEAGCPIDGAKHPEREVCAVDGDHSLAAEIHLPEDAYKQGRRQDIHDSLGQIIRDRYEAFMKGEAK